MADQEQYDIIKQGVAAWNQWRGEHQDINPDLSGADLSRDSLSGANLSITNLSGANLSIAYLNSANLSGADLREANLTEANLTEANLFNVNLIRADLRRANLRFANLSSADLIGADLRDAHIGWTVFGNTDLSVVKNLATTNHRGPSTIGIDTIYHSQGNIPEAFLRGAGVDDTFITYIRSLVGKSIEYYSCFISYSNKDRDFAERLYNDLRGKGIHCWFAPEDMKTGDKIRSRIDESIRRYDKLLIILSEHSVTSQWVEHEVETAIGRELESKPNILFPIRLDNSVMDSKTGWASHIRLTRHITDFTKWRQYYDYQKAFNRLLRDLKAED